MATYTDTFNLDNKGNLTVPKALGGGDGEDYANWNWKLVFAKSNEFLKKVQFVNGKRAVFYTSGRRRDFYVAQTRGEQIGKYYLYHLHGVRAYNNIMLLVDNAEGKEVSRLHQSDFQNAATAYIRSSLVKC